MITKLLSKPFQFLIVQLQELFRHGSRAEKAIFLSYVFASILLLIYSYTQIDLGLVISRVHFLYAIEQKFQYIGYFNRPLSTAIFAILVSLFLFLYFSIWYLTRQKKINSFTIWSIIAVVTVILTFTYNAFSYDLFNYIFDAKILTHYHQNPYIHTALNYPQDPMLGFMHWTHRTYPYGPVWLALTIPLSFIGANIFIVTFFLFKMFMASSFLASLYYIYKILLKVSESNALENLVLFALNPLVLFECLVSAHNDVVMIAFCMGALFYLMKKKYWLGILLLLFSIGIKYATFAIIPVFLFALWQKDRINKQTIYQLCFAFMLFPLLFVTIRSTFQPWYLVYILPFIPFVSYQAIRFVILLISSLSLLLYIPYLATGDWHSFWYIYPEKIVYWIIFAGVVGSGIYLLYVLTRMFNFRFAYNKNAKIS